MILLIPFLIDLIRNFVALDFEKQSQNTVLCYFVKVLDDVITEKFFIYFIHLSIKQQKRLNLLKYNISTLNREPSIKNRVR